MFTEYEIAIMAENPEIANELQALKLEFIKKEAPYLEISDHDFLSLLVMTPTVGMALANDSVSLFEEMALNKKARKMSKGGFFLKKDPVVDAMKYLISKYNDWETPFYSLINKLIFNFCDRKSVEGTFDDTAEIQDWQYKRAVFETPYILIRFISSFFLEQDEHIINERPIEKKEFNRLIEIGQKLDLNDLPIFKMFCKTFKVR